MQLKKPEDGIGRCHGDMQDELHVLSIMDIRSFNLEEVRRVAEHQLVMMRLGLRGSSLEDLA